MPDYFSHDYGARNDPKMIHLQMVMGQEGKGIFWDLIEMLYEQDGKLSLSEIDCYAYALKTDSEKIKKIINDFDLFKKDEINFWNESANRRLQMRKDKSIKSLESINNRWNNKRIKDKIRTYYERNTIKESKVKESKVNESKRKEIKETSNGASAFEIPEFLKSIWPDYLAMRTKIRKPATERAQKNIIIELAKLSNDPETQIKIIEQSITNSWQGVFQLKNQSSFSSSAPTSHAVTSGSNIRRD